LVTASTPMSIANITPKNWPEVIKCVAIPASPAGVRAWAAPAMAWALAAPLIVLSGGSSVKWSLTAPVHSAAAVSSTTALRNTHHVLVVRIFMISARTCQASAVPTWWAWPGARLSSSVT